MNQIKSWYRAYLILLEFFMVFMGGKLQDSALKSTIITLFSIISN
jgi:hypothetical protein